MKPNLDIELKESFLCQTKIIDFGILFLDLKVKIFVPVEIRAVNTNIPIIWA